MFVIAEELCSQTTIFNYLTDEGIKLFRNYNGREPIALPGKNGNVFIAEGVFEMGRTVCYKITFGGFDGFTPMSAESMKKFKLSQAVSDNFTHTLKTAADKLSSMTTGDIPLRIHGEISDISKTVSGLSQISSSLSEIVGRVSGISGSGKSYFRLSELIAYLDKAVSPLVLPKNFNDKDDSSVIFASKGGVAETLLRTCRFITATADCNVKIKFEMTHRSEMTVLHFLRECRQAHRAAAFRAFGRRRRNFQLRSSGRKGVYRIAGRKFACNERQKQAFRFHFVPDRRRGNTSGRHFRFDGKQRFRTSAFRNRRIYGERCFLKNPPQKKIGGTFRQLTESCNGSKFFITGGNAVYCEERRTFVSRSLFARNKFKQFSAVILKSNSAQNSKTTLTGENCRPET